jgi:hypothetical protein
VGQQIIDFSTPHRCRRLPVQCNRLSLFPARWQADRGKRVVLACLELGQQLLDSPSEYLWIIRGVGNGYFPLRAHLFRLLAFRREISQPHSTNDAQIIVHNG